MGLNTRRRTTLATATGLPRYARNDTVGTRARERGLAQWASVTQEHSGLTLAAVAGYALVGFELGDGAAAAGAGLAAPVVYGQKIPHLVVDLLAHVLAHGVHGVQDHLTAGVVDAAQLIVGQRLALLERIHAGVEQNLIGVSVADAGHDTPASQHALDLAAKPLQVRLEVIKAGAVQHVRTLLGQPRH